MKKQLAVLLLLVMSVVLLPIDAVRAESQNNTWQNYEGNWYYLNSNGDHVTGWGKVEDRWYFFNDQGIMQHGWQQINERWYYLGWPDDPNSGAMRHGWTELNGSWYYFGWPEDPNSGAMRQGWIRLDDSWYYFGWPDKPDSGAMRQGWLELDERWYYFGWPNNPNSGAMRHGWVEIDGKWYYLGWPDDLESGAMRTGLLSTAEADSTNPRHYYFKENGAWAEEYSGIYQLSNGIKYYLQNGKIDIKDGITSKLSGKTGVLVSIADQHLWYYKNGSLIISTPVVTGKKDTTDTSTGTFYIHTKETNARLVGPTWDVKVAYWMCLDSRGIKGLHDATWRDSFGGDIYVTDGSHGCVNLPLDAAKVIYDEIALWTEVVIY